jgi:ABC-type amino acid transport substrate-binding protein
MDNWYCFRLNCVSVILVLILVGIDLGIASAQPLQLTPSEQQWLDEHPTIRVGGEANWPPFDIQTSTGWQGITADYLELAFGVLGIKAEIVTDRPWAEKLTMLENHQLDMMGSIAKNASRLNYLNFTAPYFIVTVQKPTKKSS